MLIKLIFSEEKRYIVKQCIIRVYPYLPSEPVLGLIYELKSLEAAKTSQTNPNCLTFYHVGFQLLVLVMV